MALGFTGGVQWFGNQVNSFINRQLDSRMNDAGRRVVARATQLVPVRTGYLKSTIGYTYNTSTKVLQIHADAPYSPFVEFGTRFQVAQPYLRPAINEIGRVFGTTTEIQFPNVPHLKGTMSRPANKDALSANRASTMHLNRGNSGRARVVTRRGRWNGPKKIWSHTWNGVPSPRVRE